MKESSSSSSSDSSESSSSESSPAPALYMSRTSARAALVLTVGDGRVRALGVGLEGTFGVREVEAEEGVGLEETDEARDLGVGATKTGWCSWGEGAFGVGREGVG